MWSPIGLVVGMIKHGIAPLSTASILRKRLVSDTRKRGRPRVDATPVMVRMPPAKLAAVDLWIREKPRPKPSRPEAIRHLVELGLKAKGVL